MHARGFTLIELLVVVTILGLLASSVLAATSSSRASGRDAAQLNEIKQIQNALELYRMRNGEYPCLVNADPGCGYAPVNFYPGSPDPEDIYFTNIIAPFYKVIPSDTPSWDTTITYEAGVDSTAYRLNVRFERDRRNSAGVTIPAGTWCRIDHGPVDTTISSGGNTPCF